MDFKIKLLLRSKKKVKDFYLKKFGKLEFLPLSLSKNFRREFINKIKNQSNMFISSYVHTPIALDAKGMLWAHFSE